MLSFTLHGVVLLTFAPLRLQFPAYATLPAEARIAHSRPVTGNRGLPLSPCEVRDYVLSSLYFIREQLRAECGMPPLRMSKKVLLSFARALPHSVEMRHSGELLFEGGGYESEVSREAEP